MSGERATCPTCGSECTAEWVDRVWSLNFGGMPATTTDRVKAYRSIAADPERVQAMESLLREIDDLLLNVNLEGLPDTNYQSVENSIARRWQEKIADLLGLQKWWAP